MPFIIVGQLEYGNYSNWLNTFSFHVKRPLYWDTPFGVLRMWLGHFPQEKSASLASLILMALIFFFCPTINTLAKTIAICAASLIWNRVYSTQFHLWFIPLLLIYIAAFEKGEKLYLIILLTTLELVNICVYPFSFTYCLQEIKNFQELAIYYSGGFWSWGFSILILLRPVLLIELIFTLLCNKSGKDLIFIYLVKTSQLIYLTTLIFSMIYGLNIIQKHQKYPYAFKEAQHLKIIKKSRNFNYSTQITTMFNQRWSKNDHLFAHNTIHGDWVEHQVKVDSNDEYELMIFLTKAPDYGVIQVSLNGQNIGKYDLYAPTVSLTGAISFGVHRFSKTENILKLEVIEKNNLSRSPYYQFGFDGIYLRKAK